MNTKNQLQFENGAKYENSAILMAYMLIVPITLVILIIVIATGQQQYLKILIIPITMVSGIQMILSGIHAITGKFKIVGAEVFSKNFWRNYLPNMEVHSENLAKALF